MGSGGGGGLFLLILRPLKSATKTRPGTAPALSRLGRTSSPLPFCRFELEESNIGPARPTSIRAVTGGLPLPATFPELKKPARPKNDWRYNRW